MQLIINNSLCQVKDFTVAQYKALRSLLSYTESVRSKFGYQSRVHYLLSKKGEFPTGLLPRVQEWLSENQVPYALEDVRKRPTRLLDPLKLKLPYPPHDWQVKASESAFKAERAIVVAPTGSGKATLCAMLVAKFNVKTLLVVPTLELKTQITSTLAKAFGKDKVGPMGKDGSTPFPISVENVDSMDPKVKPKGVGLLILDEFQSSGSDTYQKLNTKAWTEIYFRVAMTATPYRSKDEELVLLESILSKIVYRLTYQEAVDHGYIVPAEFYAYHLKPIKPKGNTKSYQSMNSELIVNKEDRNAAIVDMTCKLADAGESVLILVKEIKHGEDLLARFNALGHDVGFANGENDQNRILLLEFNLGERNKLIATGVLGVGVDTVKCSTVILGAGGKSKPQLIQNIGRCLRRCEGKTEGKVIIFVESSHKWFLEHYKDVAKAIKEEYGQKIVKLDID